MAEFPPFETLAVKQDAGVVLLSLNRPDVLNAVNETMTAELQEALKRIERDPQVRCVVLTGTGRGFCSGQDLRDRAGIGDVSYGESLRNRYNPVILKLHTLEKPVIAAVNGVAAGAGVSLALAADLRIASDRASFIEVFSRVGLVPDSGSTYFLPRMVGLGKAFELAYLAEPVDAQEALRLGLVNRVFPHDELIPKTMEMARRLAAGPTRAYGLIKRALRFSLSARLDEALEYEAYAQEIAAHTTDHREGVSAFLEKRQPAFRGA